MENATKALLIAAAVLIAIVLIALGVNLLNAGGDTSDKAGQVGEALKGQTGSMADKVEVLLGGTGLTKEQVTNLLKERSSYSDEQIEQVANSVGTTKYRLYRFDDSPSPTNGDVEALWDSCNLTYEEVMADETLQVRKGITNGSDKYIIIVKANT